MASPDELRTRETGDEHLPGYAELYAELAPANPDPDTLSYVLQQRATELGLPAVAGRGGTTPATAGRPARSRSRGSRTWWPRRPRS